MSKETQRKIEMYTRIKNELGSQTPDEFTNSLNNLCDIAPLSTKYPANDVFSKAIVSTFEPMVNQTVDLFCLDVKDHGPEIANNIFGEKPPVISDIKDTPVDKPKPIEKSPVISGKKETPVDEPKP